MNAQWGISVADKGTGIIKDNDLRGNAQARARSRWTEGRGCN